MLIPSRKNAYIPASKKKYKFRTFSIYKMTDTVMKWILRASQKEVIGASALYLPSGKGTDRVFAVMW